MVLVGTEYDDSGGAIVSIMGPEHVCYVEVWGGRNGGDNSFGEWLMLCPSLGEDSKSFIITNMFFLCLIFVFKDSIFMGRIVIVGVCQCCCLCFISRQNHHWQGGYQWSSFWCFFGLDGMVGEFSFRGANLSEARLGVIICGIVVFDTFSASFFMIWTILGESDCFV